MNGLDQYNSPSGVLCLYSVLLLEYVQVFDESRALPYVERLTGLLFTVATSRMRLLEHIRPEKAAFSCGQIYTGMC
jgi:hypothetical protein